jgi:hypothetical protein
MKHYASLEEVYSDGMGIMAYDILHDLWLARFKASMCKVSPLAIKQDIMLNGTKIKAISQSQIEAHKIN